MRKQVLIFGHNYATQFVDIYNQYTQLFDSDKYEVTVAFLTGEDNEVVRQRILAPNIEFLNVPKEAIRTLKIEAIKKVSEWCKQKNFQIVICHRYKPTYIMMWVAQRQKIPALVFVMHELNTMKSRGRRLLIAALYRKNMFFAGVSNAVRDDMRKCLWRVPKERIITLHNMIDIELTEPQLLTREEARQKLNLPEDVFIFANIARLAPNKDQANLIKAYSLLKPYCPNTKLLIIGDGVLEEQLKSQASMLGLKDDVIFTGFIPGAHRYMRAFDCFILCSIQEAFGRVLLEAMIGQTPIIATRVHGIPEVLGNTNILIKPQSAVELASAMKQVFLASPQEKLQKTTRAYQHVTTHFSIPTFKRIFWEIPLLQGIRNQA